MRALRPLLASLLLFSWVGVASAASSPRYHTVASGQRLGSIAKRYSVSVEAICTANGIEREQALKVGQKLLVPSRDDKDGSMTRRQYGPPERKDEPKGSTLLASTSQPPRPVTHKVHSGQRLETIARRYQVSIEALCETNRIRRNDKLKPGQTLIIPGSLPDGGLSSLDDDKPTKSSKSTRKGYVDLSTYTTRYRGNVFDKRGKVAPGAVASISKLFGATGSRPRVDPRLIALLAEVSEHFDGRPLRVVSGWRDHSYFEDSRHKHSQAVDFSVPGVPNTVVRDYVRRFRNCGVGYYPNSSFVHLDVRDAAAYWVDYAGPGEAPRNKPRPDRMKMLADAEPSGPIEEAGGDVSDRLSPTPVPGDANLRGGAATAPASPDLTSSASRVGAATSGVTGAAPGSTGATAASAPGQAPGAASVPVVRTSPTIPNAPSVKPPR
ncbi:MAG TPA: LysM peptidoglycan-binding domain-containing protein [Polyangiaceae bacterium]